MEDRPRQVEPILKQVPLQQLVLQLLQTLLPLGIHSLNNNSKITIRRPVQTKQQTQTLRPKGEQLPQLTIKLKISKGDEYINQADNTCSGEYWKA